MASVCVCALSRASHSQLALGFILLWLVNDPKAFSFQGFFSESNVSLDLSYNYRKVQFQPQKLHSVAQSVLFQMVCLAHSLFSSPNLSLPKAGGFSLQFDGLLY